MTAPALSQPYARPTGAESGAALASLAGLIASLLPGVIMLYVLVIWPKMFGDSSVSAVEQALGWTSPPMNTGDDSALKQIAYPIFFVVACVCALFTGAYRRVQWLNPGVLAILAMIALATLSMFWSGAPGHTRMRAMLLGIIALTFILSVYTATYFDLMMKAIVLAMLVATGFNLIAVVTAPPSPIGHPGIYPQKNVFGWVASMIFIFGLYQMTTGRLWLRLAGVAMVAAGPVFLYLSESKTSFGLALLAPSTGLVLLYAARRMRLSPALLIPLAMTFLALVFFVGSAAGQWTFHLVLETLLRDGTLTGRTDLWELAGRLMERRPWLGYGYEAVWGNHPSGVAYNNALGFPRVAPTAHNGYVDIWLFMGVPGLAVLAVFLLAVLATAGKVARLDPRLGFLTLTVTVFVLLHNNLESDIMISSNPLSMLLMLFFLVGLRLTRGRRL